MTKTIILDKIGSVLKNLGLKPEVTLTDELSCDMGTVLAAEVLEDKSVYNGFELVSGRMSTLKKGDLIAVTLGGRMALKGFTGRLPRRCSTGDVIHLLNFGGVAGICTSANVQEVGEPLRIRVLGGIADKQGTIMNIKDASLFSALDVMKNDTPLIIVTGTSMDSGKTTAATEIVKTLTRMGMKLAGTKLTGVGAHRDIYKMLDNGVSEAVSFTDCGISSTANIDDQTMISVAKGALQHLSKGNPDAIIIEFGDGLMGKYGVDAILSDSQIQSNVRLHIGCASDPVGAVGLARECERIGLPLDVLSGPVTDNEVGKQIIAEHVKDCLTYNAFKPSNEWLDLVLARWMGLTEAKRNVA